MTTTIAAAFLSNRRTTSSGWVSMVWFGDRHPHVNPRHAWILSAGQRRTIKWLAARIRRSATCGGSSGATSLLPLPKHILDARRNSTEVLSGAGWQHADQPWDFVSRMAEASIDRIPSGSTRLTKAKQTRPGFYLWSSNPTVERQVTVKFLGLTGLGKKHR